MKRLLVSALCLMALPGCINPPTGTVFIDTDGDGRVDALAWDRNRDGIPDKDAEGKPDILAESKGYVAAETADAILPQALMALGGALGVPILVGVGAAWKGARFGRIFMNTVMSIQVARQRLKDKGSIEALAMLDETLEAAQTEKTIAMVKEVKEKLSLPSVTG